MANQAINDWTEKYIWDSQQSTPLGMLMKMFQERINSECEQHHPIGWDREGIKIRQRKQTAEALFLSFCISAAITGGSRLALWYPPYSSGLRPLKLWDKSFLLQGVLLRYCVSATTNLNNTASTVVIGYFLMFRSTRRKLMMTVTCPNPSYYKAKWVRGTVLAHRTHQASG